MPPKNNTQNIKKYTHVEHVLNIPDTYIGSTEMTTECHWVYNEEKGKMEKKTLNFCPGEYQLKILKYLLILRIIPSPFIMTVKVFPVKSMRKKEFIFLN